MQTAIDADLWTLVLMIAATSAEWPRLWTSVPPLSILLGQKLKAWVA